MTMQSKCRTLRQCATACLKGQNSHLEPLESRMFLSANPFDFIITGQVLSSKAIQGANTVPVARTRLL